MRYFLGLVLPSQSRSVLNAAGFLFAMTLLFPRLGLCAEVGGVLSVSSIALAAQSASATRDPCIFGFEPSPQDGKVQDAFHLYKKAGQVDLTVQPSVIDWMEQSGMQSAYALWQASRRCGMADDGGGDPLPSSSLACQSRAPIPKTVECSGEQDGYAFLAMHRQMLHAFRATWPSLQTHFEGWGKFPKAEDFPVEIRDAYFAWPDAVVRAAELVDGMSKMRRDEVLARWKNEGEFGHWIQCGSTQPGMGVNSLYGALRFNGMSNIQDHNLANPMRSPDAYLFWKMHGWIDKAWDKYRRAIGKTPDDPELQADLIQQCQVLQGWASKTQTTPVEPNQPADSVFLHGHFNTAHTQAVRLLGEIMDVKVFKGRQYVQLDLRLKGITPKWITASAKIAEGELRLGDRFVFIGYVRAAKTLDPSGALQQFLNSPSLLIAQAIQSPK